jgi:SAM-dependent methyltransferase
MEPTKRYKKQKEYWENAGHVGYGDAIFSNATIEKHIVEKQWRVAIETSHVLQLNRQSRILELGCGDGEFAENILSSHFNHIDACDVSSAAIQRARSQVASSKVNYFVADISTYEYEASARWDGAFLMLFLHHVKHCVPAIISRLAKVCPKLIVLEPNGDNLIRKSLELLPSYQKAGEDSFRLKQLIGIFSSNGYKLITMQRINLIPQFLPEKLFPVLAGIENFIEPKPILNRICSTYAMGFELTHEPFPQ